MNQKEKILEQAALVFMQNGIKSVTLDDLAIHLKISKKTFYNYFTNKEDLVCQALLWYLAQDKAGIQQELNKHENPIDEIIAVSKFAVERLKAIHPSIHYDLQKYYPKAWAELEKYKKGFIAEMFMKNLRKGQEKGLYRTNFNPEIVTRLYIQKIDLIFNPVIFPPSEYPFGKIYLELVLHHIYGVVSKKGYNYLEKKIKIEKLDI